jgi:hypothetical protein
MTPTPCCDVCIQIYKSLYRESFRSTPQCRLRYSPVAITRTACELLRGSLNKQPLLLTGSSLYMRRGAPRRLHRRTVPHTSALRQALAPTRSPFQRVPGVKRPGREANHSPPSNAEVKKSGATPPLLHMSSWHSA